MNEHNLIPNSQRSPSELKRMTSKGGKQSGEVRRQRKTQREQLEMLLSLPLKSDKAKAQIQALGIDASEVDNQMAMNVAMVKGICFVLQIKNGYLIIPNNYKNKKITATSFYGLISGNKFNPTCSGGAASKHLLDNWILI